MTEQTLQSVNEFFIIWDKIKKNELPETDFNNFFLKLSKCDYRNEYEKRIDYYIEKFSSGAFRTEEIPEIEWTARNSPHSRNIKDVYYYCKLFLKEHFVHVQKPFWEKYKNSYRDINAVTTKEISEIIKVAKNENKRNKK